MEWSRDEALAGAQFYQEMLEEERRNFVAFQWVQHGHAT